MASDRHTFQADTVLSYAIAMDRRYYSLRTGKNKDGLKLQLDGLKALFLSEFQRLDGADYFQEYFGYFCVDNGHVPGKRGTDIAARMSFDLRKPDLWPVDQAIPGYSEDDLFDVIEYLFDNISKPVEGRFHSYGNCGMHYSTFDRDAGRAEYRAEINKLLETYSDGFELNEVGEILELAPQGMQEIFAAEVPNSDPNVAERVASAIQKFRRYKATTDERRDAVRDLADVLEYLRPQAKRVLVKADENDLFNIANNFAVRHHNTAQKSDYDKGIWLSWMFYFYLSTIHACIRLIDKADGA
jgi:hypothetical protein